ncbi:MAG: hypothetical protein ABI273_01710 [Lacunisphaera sp.]
MKTMLYLLFRRVLMAGFACVTGSTCLAAPSTNAWIKIQTNELLVYSDAPQKEVVECTLRYVAYRRAFSKLFGVPAADLPASTLIIFRTKKSFLAAVVSEQRPNTETLNYSAEVDGVPLNGFALSDDLDAALQSTFEFETIWTLPRVGYSVPIWMSQGAGEVLSSLSIAKGRCMVGHYIENTYRDTFEWEPFFGMTTTSEAYRDPRQLSDYLGQAWGLMHWVLLDGDHGGADGEHFMGIARRLARSNALDAVVAEMNTDVAHLNRAISRHLSQSPLTPIPFDETAERARLVPQVAPEVEVLIQMANLLNAAGKFRQSDAQLDRAIALAPDLPLVKEASARQMERDQRPDDALRLYREAITKGSTNASAYLVSATARLEKLRITNHEIIGHGGTEAQLAADELRQAVRLSPSNAEAFDLLGRALLLQPEISQKDVADLTPGIARDGNKGTVLYYRALLYSRLGQMEKSHADLLEIIHDIQLPKELRQNARSRFIEETVTADAKQIEEFLQKKNYAAARAIVQTGSARLDDEGLHQMYHRLSSIIDEQEATESPRTGK